MTLYRDRTGRDIRVGDLLKLYHFIGSRGKRHYQYFLVFKLDGLYRAAHPTEIPTRGLTVASSVPLSIVANDPSCEIVNGYACVGNELSFEDRPRVKSEDDGA